MIDFQTTFERLLAITILSGIIGFEREKRNQPAGLRTHIILGIGSALTMLISIRMTELFPDNSSDPSRIASQVVTGVGFLGAGAILRFGPNVKGLTTAASLWTTAMIGLAVGSGYYSGGFFATFVIILTLSVLNKVEKIFLGSKGDKSLLITAVESPDLLANIEKILTQEKISIVNIKVYKNSLSHEVDINAVIRIPVETDLLSIQKKFSDVKYISEVEIR